MVWCVCSAGGNIYVDAPRPGRIYLPGSFNPLHDGHKDMLEVGASLCCVAASGACPPPAIGGDGCR